MSNGFPHRLRQAVQEELLHWPWVETTFGRGSRHYYVEIRHGRRRERVFMPFIGNGRSEEEKTTRALQYLRRALRSLDLERSAPEPKASLAPPCPTPAREQIEPGLADVRRAATLQRIARWSGFRVPEARRNEAAMALLESWHPTAILDAADLLLEVDGFGDEADGESAACEEEKQRAVS